MSDQPGVTSTLELVERIRTTVREFAAKEEALNQEFRLKIGSVQRRRDQETEALKQQLPEELAREESAFLEAQERATRRHARRKTRIAQLHKTLNKRAAEWIEDREGRRKHKLQTETLQSDKNKKTGIADTEKAYADFSETLAAEQQALANIEEKARKSFAGYGSFGRRLSASSSANQPDAARDEYQLFDELRALLNATEEDLGRFRGLILASLFRLLPLWLVAALIPLALVAILPSLGVQGFSIVHGAATAGGLVVLSLVFHQVGRKQGQPIATRIAQSLVRARRLHEVCTEKSASRRTSELERIEKEFQAKRQWIAEEWDSTLEDAGAERRSLPQAVEAKVARAAATNERLHRQQAERRESGHVRTVASLNEANAAKLRDVAAAGAAREAKLEAELSARWQPIEAEWKARIQSLYAEVETARLDAAKLFPPWQPD